MRALAILFLASCYSPDIKDGQFTCSDGVTCPSGFVCACGSCVKNPSNMSCVDGGAGEDLAGVDLAGEDLAVGDLASADLTASSDLSKPGDMATLPGCSTGARAPNDPGKAKLALCPAAWAQPGIHPATTHPCNGVVDATGKNGATNCTTEDNCAMGWHVCRDMADIVASGLSDCTAITQGFWIAAQKGEPPPSPQPMGPPICDGLNYHSVFGCGSITQVGGAPQSSGCSTFLFSAVLVNPPDGTDHCSVSTSGNFVCGANAIEADNVTKTTRAGGGVMCCQN